MVWRLVRALPSRVPTLTLAHSCDPDDAFMWWPITGMVSAEGKPLAGDDGGPVIDTGGFEFRAVPGDIGELNERAVSLGDCDITAISMRTYVDVRERYVMTSCGGSFGDGYGPKVVCRDESPLRAMEDLAREDVRVAVPGLGTTALLALRLLLGEAGVTGAHEGLESAESKYVAMRFDVVGEAVRSGEAQAGVIIHDAQLTFERQGLRLLGDLGAWWKGRRGLPLPLGANVVRRDMDARFGAGTSCRVCGVLEASIRYAMAHRGRGVTYAASFAETGGESSATLADVDRFIELYVNSWTLDMGDVGLNAVRRLLGDGARAGLCPDPGEIDILRPAPTLR